MIISLSVKNLAILENIEIDFKDKMTVLTGETGAGKSLIIDAISYLFGNRSSFEMIRTGEEKAVIEGVFVDNSAIVNQMLIDMGVEVDNEIIVRREISINNKNTCRVNGVLISLNKLAEIAEYFGDIHQQNDTIGLVNPKNYLEFIDNNIDKNIKEEYISAYELLKLKSNELKDLKNKQKAFLEQEEFLRYQLDELNNAKIDVKEEKELKDKVKNIDDFEKINGTIDEFKRLYNEENIMDKIYESLTYLKNLEKYFPGLSKDIAYLQDSYYSIEDVLNKVKKLAVENVDPSELDYINERLFIYNNLQKKYKKTSLELLDFKNQISDKINSLDSFDLDLKKLEKDIKEIHTNLQVIANKVSSLRVEEAKKLEEKASIHLNDLQLFNAIFKIEFKKIDFSKNGIDEIDFLVSFNKGEKLKSLSKVASGGELSRFMLALKTSINSQLNSKLFIFDEINQGVSGNIAQSIAKKIKMISKDNQVLCISHLPQIAAIADYNIKITKETDNNRTYALAKYLNHEERILEIASMISKEKITESSISLAKELLKQ